MKRRNVFLLGFILVMLFLFVACNGEENNSEETPLPNNAPLIYLTLNISKFLEINRSEDGAEQVLEWKKDTQLEIRDGTSPLYTIQNEGGEIVLYIGARDSKIYAAFWNERDGFWHIVKIPRGKEIFVNVRVGGFARVTVNNWTVKIKWDNSNLGKPTFP